MFNFFVLYMLKVGFWLIQVIFTPRGNRDFEIDLSRIQRILLVTTTAIGDTLMCTPAIRAVRMKFPGSKLSVLVDRRRVQLLEGNPYIDHITVYPGKFKNVLKLIRQLRFFKPDMVIILHANDPDIVPLVYLSGAPVRIGWAESAFDFLLTHPVKREQEPLHFIAQRNRYLLPIGIRDAPFNTELYASSKAVEFVQGYFKKTGVHSANTLIAFHPFASRGTKEWPEEYARELLLMLTRDPEIRVFILGGPEESEKKARLTRKLPDAVINLGNEFDLDLVTALLSRCNLFIGTDSGPMHMAVALNIPRVTMFGPETPDLYGNQSNGAIELVADIRCSRPCKLKVCPQLTCMRLISPHMVYEASLELLKSHPFEEHKRGTRVRTGVPAQRLSSSIS